MLHNDTKQKRNKPCENCRAHRRKCIVNEDKTICERCLRMSIPCLFKFSTKPIIPKKSVSTSKKNRLLQKVWSLENDAKMLEAEFEHISQQHQQQLQKLQQQHPPWNLTLQKLKNGFQLNTNITNVQDLLVFLQQSSHFFQAHEYLSTASPSTSLPSMMANDKPIIVTIRSTPMEHALRKMFSLMANKPSSSSSISSPLNHPSGSNISLSSGSSTSSLCLPSSQPQPTPSFSNTTTSPSLLVHSSLDQHQYTYFLSVKRYLIDLYFQCGHLHHPLLIQPYFQPYMQDHLEDMMSWVVVAYVAYSPCQHVNPSIFEGLPWSRQELGEICRTEARRLLEDALFDCDGNDQLSISWMFTSHLLTQCAFFTLQNKSAKVYADSAWHMAVVLKEIYVPILRKHHQQQQKQQQQQQQQQHQQQSTSSVYLNQDYRSIKKKKMDIDNDDDDDDDKNNDELQLIFAETWRRLYYATRYCIIALNIVNNSSSEIPQMAIHMKDIGLPQPLFPYEQEINKELYESVFAYHFATQLDHDTYFSCNTKITSIRYELYTGKMESISVNDLLALEKRLIDFWYGLPELYRLSNSPIDYIQMDRVHQCPSVRFLRVNAGYYMYWLSTLNRVMKDPSLCDISNSSLNHINGERAVLIVSMCCDALVKIYHVLYLKLPCTVEIHWVAIVLDSILLLLNAKNVEIKQRAHQNARMAKHIYNQLLENSYQSTTSSLTSNFMNPPTSSPTTSSFYAMNNQSNLYIHHPLQQQQQQQQQFNPHHQQLQQIQPMDEDQMTTTISTATYSSSGSNASMILDSQHSTSLHHHHNQHHHHQQHQQQTISSSSLTLGSSPSCASPSISQDTYMTMDSNDLAPNNTYTNDDIIQKSSLYGSYFNAIKQEMDAQLATKSSSS
ncbi:hypothetical protein BJ944DRAFT_251322 [Cunninghamella echinulata]|nr:hypothetical protein BJ944DRAFT_251322 [Cunninghamella echinulata]